MRLYTSDCNYEELTPSKNVVITKEQSRLKRRTLRRKLERGE